MGAPNAAYGANRTGGNSEPLQRLSLPPWSGRNEYRSGVRYEMAHVSLASTQGQPVLVLVLVLVALVLAVFAGWRLKRQEGSQSKGLAPTLVIVLSVLGLVALALVMDAAG